VIHQDAADQKARQHEEEVDAPDHERTEEVARPMQQRVVGGPDDDVPQDDESAGAPSYPVKLRNSACCGR
jgi:hypothetical protein